MARGIIIDSVYDTQQWPRGQVIFTFNEFALHIYYVIYIYVVWVEIGKIGESKII